MYSTYLLKQGRYPVATCNSANCYSHKGYRKPRTRSCVCYNESLPVSLRIAVTTIELPFRTNSHKCCSHQRWAHEVRVRQYPMKHSALQNTTHGECPCRIPVLDLQPSYPRQCDSVRWRSTTTLPDDGANGAYLGTDGHTTSPCGFPAETTFDYKTLHNPSYLDCS